MPLHPKIAREQDIAVLARGLQRVNRTAGTQRTSNAGTWFIPDGTFDENGIPTGGGVVIGSQANDFDGIAHRNPDGTLKPLVDTSAIDDKLNSAQEDIDKLNQSLVQVDKTLVAVNQTLEDNRKTIAEAQKSANNALSTATSANETARQANENATQAQTAADKAQNAATQTASDLTELAGITGRVIFSDTAPTGSAQNSNNMWVDGNGRPHEWNGSQWVLVTDSRITSAAQAANEAHQTAVDAQSAADAARDQALNALNEAQTANGNAQNAQNTANAAKTTAQNAAATANAAKTAADNAQDAASSAKTAATAAQAAANSAKSIADAATQNVADLAEITGRVIYSSSAPTGADRNGNNLWIDSNGQPHRWNGSAWALVTDSRITSAANTANQANSAAQSAQNAAQSAQNTAKAAQTAANDAKTAAQNAQTAATSAQNAANTAKDAAADAKTTASEAKNVASSARSAATQAQATATAANQAATSAQTAANQALTSATQYIKNQQFTGSNIDGVLNTRLNANDPAAGTLPQSAKTYGKSTGGYDNRFENVRIKGIPGHTYRIECDVRPASGFDSSVGKGVSLFFWFMRSDNPGLTKNHYTSYNSMLVPPTVKDWTHATYDYVFPNNGVDKVMRPAWRTPPDSRWLITNCVCYDATEYIALQKLADTAQDAANKANTAAQNAAAIANRAEAAAKNAQTTANGKNKIFTQSSEPSHSGLVPGDQWNVTNSSGQVTSNRVWNGSSFVEHKLYLSSLAVPSSVGTTLIQDNAITTGKVAANAINASKIAADAVTADKIASNAVTADSIASNAVGTNELAANAVTTAKLNVTEDMTVKLLAAHKIEADEIDLNTLNGVTINGMTINGGELSVGNTGNRIHIHNNADISNIDFMRNGSEIAKMYFIYEKSRNSTVFVISSGQEQITNRAYVDGAQPDPKAPNGWTISSNHDVRILPQHTLDMFGETCSMQFTNAVNVSTGRMTLRTSGGKIYLGGNADTPINTLARCRVNTYDNNANRFEFDMPTFQVFAGNASLFASATGANGTRGIRVKATGLYAICGQVNVNEVNGNSGEIDIRRTPNGAKGWSSVMSTGFTAEPASFSGGWTSVTIPWQYVYLNSSDVVTLGFTNTWARRVGGHTMMSIRPVAL